MKNLPDSCTIDELVEAMKLNKDLSFDINKVDVTFRDIYVAPNLNASDEMNNLFDVGSTTGHARQFEEFELDKICVIVINDEVSNIAANQSTQSLFDELDYMQELGYGNMMIFSVNSDWTCFDPITFK